jgi:hypothetical protein
MEGGSEAGLFAQAIQGWVIVLNKQFANPY